MSESQVKTGAERREAERKSLMLRSAKVVCQTGEYICLVRDVSELGTSLSFMHDVPPEPRIILALSNGLTYPIERVWTGKRQAGFRFGAQVDMQEFMHETSPYEARPIRLDICATAHITDGRDSFGAKLLDISAHGAKVECDAELKQQRLLGFQVSGMKQRLGQIMWSDISDDIARHGIQFQHPIALQELADAALRLQPFDTPIPGGFSEPLSKARAA